MVWVKYTAEFWNLNKSFLTFRQVVGKIDEVRKLALF
jgi:hypothetical protein